MIPAEAPYTGKQPFTAEHLQSVMRYEDGRLFWTENADPRCVGKPVYQLLRNGRYFWIRYKRKRISAHRAIWAVCHGRWPEREIDHINRIPSDNRIENLRDVSRSENMLNKPRRFNSARRARTAVVGGWVTRTGAGLTAFIKVAGKRIYLGRFPIEEEAEAAREGASRLLAATQRSAPFLATGSP